MDWQDHETTLPWMAKGEAVFSAAVDRIDDDALRGASLLPGWSRAHVIGHVARNADGLRRLAEWARTGVEAAMYASTDVRTAEIEDAAAQPSDALRADLVNSAARLDEALAELDEAAWAAQVRTYSGHVIPASGIAWIRLREVWLHTVDLATDVTFDDLPAPLVDVLLDDVTKNLGAQPGCPAVRLVPVDRGSTWRFGPPGPDATDVNGTAAELLGWVTGRTGGPEPSVTLPSWI